MSRKSLDHFGELQRAVIEVVWELGEASVRQVWKRLCRNKELAYTTVLTAMQRLERAGWLKHRDAGHCVNHRVGRWFARLCQRVVA